MLTVYKARGYRPATFSELETIPITPQGERSDRWMGVQHAELVTGIKDCFQDAGLEIKESKYSLQKTGHGLVGGFVFDTPQARDTSLVPDYDLACGFMHDNQSRRGLRLALGATVRICSNGMVTGEVVWKRKHTRGLVLNDWLRVGVDHFMNSVEDSNERIERLSTIEIDREADHVLMQLGRRKVLSWKNVGKAYEKWLRPTHEEFQARNAFNLYQAFNETVKTVPMQSQFDALHRGFKVFEQALLLN